MTHGWLIRACHGLNSDPSLNTESRRGAEVQCSFRPPELQYAEGNYGIFA